MVDVGASCVVGDAEAAGGDCEPSEAGEFVDAGEVVGVANTWDQELVAGAAGGEDPWAVDRLDGVG